MRWCPGFYNCWKLDYSREDKCPRIITDLLMARLLLYALSDDLRSLLLCHRLDALSIVRLDVAVSSATTRLYWITLLKSLRSESIDNMHHSAPRFSGWYNEESAHRECRWRVMVGEYLDAIFHFWRQSISSILVSMTAAMWQMSVYWKD